MKSINYKNTGISLIAYSFIFFSWGLLTSLNGTLIGHLNNVLDLNESRNMLINFTFFATYFVIAFLYYSLSDKYDFLLKLGYKYMTVAGLVIAAIGALMFYPASILLSFTMFMVALIILASGITILQLAANTYIIDLSIDGLGASRLNLVQALNSLGATLGPVLGGVLILNEITIDSKDLYLLSAHQLYSFKFIQAQALQLPYWFLATALFVLAAIIFFLPMPDLKNSNQVKNNSNIMGANIGLASIGIFVYVGAEVTIGSNLGNLIDGHYKYLNVDKTFLITSYWGMAMIGRFLGAFLMRKVNSGFLLMIFAALATFLVFVGLLNLGELSLYALVFVGFFNSIMFPTIYANGIFQLKENTGRGAALLIMAIAGGAIIPLIYTFLKDTMGDFAPLIIAALCYGFISYYGYYFSKLNNQNI